ncbi:VWA domain-containing protein [Corynebacterium sp. YIM 101645]|uniref:VWA domain-containing protein n=1 Tax=Corynebacterium lemuris TaxID=1859292 RepID=A0ABT2FU65_9CORY|nr:VWA domain-containing protein [Corynebacterium lemuris]MCS5478769.1 VWA domain-containing protein [Corynebacterium lemuris]
MGLVTAALLVVTLLTVPQKPPAAEAQAANPSQPSFGQCGGSVALVFDLSNSLTRSNVDNLKRAANTLIDTLKGAPYTMGLYSFATSSPAFDLRNLPATSLQDEAGQSQLRGAVNALYNRPNSNDPQGGTNWQGGLRQVANDMDNGVEYDVVYFITDGVPTFDDAGAHRGGNSTELREINNAIAQKNRIENRGGRVISVGVGASITDNTPINIYDSLLGLLWRVDSRDTPRNILNRVATNPANTIIVNDYAQLPQQLANNFTTGCLHVSKQIVDGGGQMIEPGAGWVFDLSVSSGTGSLPRSTVTTNGQGFAEVVVNNASTTSRPTLRISERQQPGFQLTPDGNRAAQCRAYRPGQSSQPVEAIRDGDNAIRVQMDPARIIACTFSNRPVVPVQLGKEVQINTEQLQEELNNRTYDFNYECRDGGTVLASGRAEDLVNGQLTTLGNFPLGTTCDVTEVQPDTDAERFEVETTWRVEGADVLTTSEDGLSTRIQPNAQAYTTRSGTRVRAVNTYEAEMATIRLSKHIPGISDLPIGQLPNSITVDYTCRYVPDPDNPPEQGGGGNPYYVTQGQATFPREESTEIGPFPVGTQCGFEEISPATAPIAIPGFDLAVGWNSDICLRSGESSETGLNRCDSNYIWIPTAGEHNLEVENTYSRQLSALVITKEVTGEAESAGTSALYNFDVVCRDGGTEVFRRETVSVTADGSTRIAGVPAASECTISEQETNIPGIDVSIPEPQTVTIGQAGTDTEVNVTNDLSYQRGEIWIEKTVDTTGVADLEDVVELQGRSFEVTAQCVLPGPGETEIREITLSDGQSELVGSFPVGTTCSFGEAGVEVPENIEHVALFNPQSVTVASQQETTIELVNEFRTASGNLIITKNVAVTGTAPDAEQIIPGQFLINYSCVTGPTGSVSLGNGDIHVVEGVPEGTACTISEVADDVEEFERTTVFSGRGQSTEGDSHTFVFPSGGGSATIAVRNTYTPALGNVNVAKQAALTHADGRPSGDVLQTAVVGGPQTFPVSYRCERNGREVDSGAFNIFNGQTTPVTLPVGAECEFIESAPDIAATQDPEISFSGDGVETGAGFLVSVGTGDQSFTVNNEYTMQTGGFNLKKKVDGEGVATIGADRQFAVDYVCTLNSTVVAQGNMDVGRFDSAETFAIRDLPVGTTCRVTEDPVGAAEENADWSARWTVAQGTTGWEAEQNCSLLNNCRENPDSQNVVDLTVGQREQAETADGHFQGTLVVWNTYDYHKVNLAVDKNLAGDGDELAAGDTFTFNMVCSPADAGATAPDRIIRQAVQVTGDGSAVAPTKVPIGYDCQINEHTVAGYDATVSTSFDGAQTESGGPVDPTGENGATASFRTAGENGATQTVTVTNAYERERGDLVLTKQLWEENPNTVNDHLVDGEFFDVTWRCEDPLAGRSYEGTERLPSDGTAVEIARAGVAQGQDPRLPASVICSFTELVDGKIPAGFEEVVNAHHSIRVTRGEAVTREQFGVTAIRDVGLVPNRTTTVNFRNTYWVDQINLGLNKFLEGDPDHEVIPAETAFHFTFTCTVPNLLPGQRLSPLAGQEASSPDGREISGSFELAQGEQWSTGPLPVGSTCEVTEGPTDPVLLELLEENGLRMQPNYFYPAESHDPPSDPEDTDEPVLPDLGGGERRPLGEGQSIILSREDQGGQYGQYAFLLNSLFRTEGEVQVQKVMPDLTPLDGARFAIFGVDPDNGGPSATPVAEDLGFAPLRDENGDIVYDSDDVPLPDPTRFTVSLPPGSYYLVETRSGTGAELLPQPFRFDLTGSSETLGDLEFRLSAFADHSGLITVRQSVAGDPTSPWIVQVANIAAGELPLSGGRGIWLTVALGTGLLLAGGTWYFWIRRREN